MDVNYIKDLIKEILDKTFTDSKRREIHEYEDRLNFCCPVCLDSTKTAHKKRGNIYFDRLMFICYRCSLKCNLNTLCKQYNIRVDLDKKLEMMEHVKDSYSKSKCRADMNDVDLSLLIDLSKLEEVLNTTKQILTEFKPIVKFGLVYEYLLDRGINEDMHTNIYQAKHWYTVDRYEYVMVSLNRRGEKILGIQTRNLRKDKFRSFKIYNYETLYKWTHDDDNLENIDLNQLIIYNKISYFFNILNVDFDSTITLFEGYLDSLFYPNSIGVTGVNCDLSVLENANLDLQYFYDNDDAGYKKSDEKIKMGFKVFLWFKLFEYIVDKKKNEDPYKLMERISKVKDLNKLSQFVNNPYNSLRLYEFFSKDIYDIKYIPKVKFDKYKTNKKLIK